MGGRRQWNDHQLRVAQGFGQVIGQRQVVAWFADGHLPSALVVLDVQATDVQQHLERGGITPPQAGLMPLFSHFDSSGITAVSTTQHCNFHGATPLVSDSMLSSWTAAHSPDCAAG
ncbi:hypothetical protein D3C87_1856080 [compost metagenome]